MKKQAFEQSVNLVPVEIIQNKIYLIRGRKAMLDRDLAELYGVETRRLNEQVKRNLKRFPLDFMYQLTKEEAENWMSQIAISNKESLRSQIATLKRGKHIKYLPYVFTEQGVAMLSSVLNSDRAIEVNIQIMRVFTELREMMATHKDLAYKIEGLERKFQQKFQEHDKKIILIFDAIKELLAVKEETTKKRGPMGFVPTHKVESALKPQKMAKF